MRRITVEEARAAVEATGLRLKRGVTYAHDERCACPIGALAAAAGVALPGYAKVSDAAVPIGLALDYAFAFAATFDDPDEISRVGPSELDTEAIRMGIEDGKAVAVALLPRERAAS